MMRHPGSLTVVLFCSSCFYGGGGIPPPEDVPPPDEALILALVPADSLHNLMVFNGSAHATAGVAVGTQLYRSFFKIPAGDIADGEFIDPNDQGRVVVIDEGDHIRASSHRGDDAVWHRSFDPDFSRSDICVLRPGEAAATCYGTGEEPIVIPRSLAEALPATTDGVFFWDGTFTVSLLNYEDASVSQYMNVGIGIDEPKAIAAFTEVGDLAIVSLLHGSGFGGVPVTGELLVVDPTTADGFAEPVGEAIATWPDCRGFGFQFSNILGDDRRIRTAVSGSTVYAFVALECDFAAGAELTRLDLETRTLTPIATTLGKGDLVIDDEAIYWIDAGAENTLATGSVWRQALDGGDVELLVEGITSPLSIDADADFIYWTQQGAGGIDDTSVDGDTWAIVRLRKDAPAIGSLE